MELHSYQKQNGKFELSHPDNPEAYLQVDAHLRVNARDLQ